MRHSILYLPSNHHEARRVSNVVVELFQVEYRNRLHDSTLDSQGARTASEKKGVTKLILGQVHHMTFIIG